MKRWLALFLTCFCLWGLTGCVEQTGTASEEQLIITGTVAEVHKDSFVLHAQGEDLLFSLPAEKENSYTRMTVGDEIVVYYTESNRSTYPEQVSRTLIRAELMMPTVTTAPAVSGGKIDTPAESSFAVRVSWSEDERIAAYAWNSEKLKDAEGNALPVFRMASVQELEAFQTEFGDVLCLEHGWDEISAFSEEAACFDDAFFAQNELALVYVTAGSGSDRFGLARISRMDDALCFQVRCTNQPEIGTTDLAGWLIGVPVPRSVSEDHGEWIAVMIP